MERFKELLDDGLTLAPIKLLGGFICVDFHLGCVGCLYCLNRRHPLLHALLEQNLHLDMPLSPEQVADMVLTLPSARHARVPIRLGHLTDWYFQKMGTSAFCRAMPEDYPIVIMTRFPLDGEQIALLGKHSNALAHVTLTPPVPGVEAGDPQAIIASTTHLPRSRVVHMLRPLVADNEVWHRRLLAALPSGSFVAFGRMSTDSIPGIASLRTISWEEMDNLRLLAQEMGLIPLAMFGCLLRQQLVRPFFKYHHAKDLPQTYCPQCSNQEQCRTTLQPLIPEEMARFHVAVQELELSPREIRFDAGSILIDTDQPAGRGEEVYLSERFNRDVQITTVTRGEEKGVRFLDDALYQRWQRTGFFPVQAMQESAAVIRQQLPTSLGTSP